MISYSGVKIESIIVHHVGNKAGDETIQISKSPIQLEENLEEILTDYFLKPFKNPVFNQFTHSSDINLNEVYHFVNQIFSDPSTLYLQSIQLAKHLFEQTTHPAIKGGEFYVVYFDGIQLGDEIIDAVGLFKSENKDTFLQVHARENIFEIESLNGININKLDKGCLVLNIDKELGYRVCSVDHTNKGDEALYWKTNFLNIEPRKDSFHHTENYLKLCKSYLTEQFPDEFEASKTDQIDMLNRSVNFFKKNEDFEFNDFASEVMQQPELIDSFKDYKSKYQEDREISIVDEFSISEKAVKQQAKIFKSVLKLDKNFHIYIHGDKDMIEKGVDPANGMKYYKIFYKEEN